MCYVSTKSLWLDVLLIIGGCTCGPCFVQFDHGHHDHIPLPASSPFSFQPPAAIALVAVDAASAEASPALKKKITSREKRLARQSGVKPPPQPNKFAGGLSKLCSIVLGKALNKQEQMSHWRRRPLSASQQEYAALDAFVGIMLIDAAAAMDAPIESWVDRL